MGQNNQQINQKPFNKQINVSKGSKRILRLLIWFLIAIIIGFASIFVPSYLERGTSRTIDCKEIRYGFPNIIYYKDIPNSSRAYEPGGPMCYGNSELKYYALTINLAIYFIILVIIDTIALKMRDKRVYLLNILFFLILYAVAIMAESPSLNY